MNEKQLNEKGLADLAYRVEADHEVQMARAEIYKVAKYAIKLQEVLKGVSEQVGLEGWVQSKITKAADYMASVYHHMDYENAFEAVKEGKYKNDAQRKAVHASKNEKKKNETVKDPYKESLASRLEAKKKVVSEGPFKGVGKQLMKRKLNKQYKKSDLANFDKSGIDTSGKTPDEVGQMKSDFYHDNMDKAARAKKAGDRLSAKKKK